MKKFQLLGLCLLACATATAQTSLVKDVERQMKSDVTKYPANLEKLQPAFTDAESSKEAYTWFVAGKGGYDYFDNQQGMKQIGKTVDDKAMGHALINSYGYLRNALTNDTVTDAKGKVKTKYSKDVIKLINTHYGDYNTAAVYLWGVQDYAGAYDAWTLYTSIPNDPVLGVNAPKAPADTVLCEIYYNKALAAWQAEKLDDALTAFEEAMALGYNKKNVFDYSIGVAYQLHRTDKMAEYATIAYPLYGKEDYHYINYIINDKLQAEQYDEAMSLLNKYIAEDPSNSHLYYAKGLIYDVQGNFEEAAKSYKEALSYDPNDVNANLNYGRQLYNMAVTLDDQSQSLSTQEYNKVRFEQINPLYKEAIPYLEKALELDPENAHNALAPLRSIYYTLNDDANLKRIEELQKTY
jgi:tetratricopeptide (TPR) repeat protein